MEVISDSVVCRTDLATVSLVCKLQPKENYFFTKKGRREKDIFTYIVWLTSALEQTSSNIGISRKFPTAQFDFALIHDFLDKYYLPENILVLHF